MIQFQGKMLFLIVSYFTIYIICWDIATGVELLYDINRDLQAGEKR